MARLFLINPLTDEPIRSPLLAFLYLAASLRRAGHEVELFDGSASNAPAGTPQLVERIRGFGPDVVGIHCKTLYALESYGLARELRELGVTAPFVCGGPHPTVVPLEPLAHGFEFSVRGEGEETLVELCDALDGKRQMSTVRSLVFRDTTGAIQLNEPRGFLLELDQLAKPADALDLFDPAWYGKSEPVPPAGLLSSRGCPAACTFCSNNVTGRRFRYRSPELIKEEIEHFARIAGLRAFAFFDDSFAVGRRRVEELCAVLKAMPEKPMWTCTAHPAHLHRDVMLMMKQAGCGGEAPAHRQGRHQGPGARGALQREADRPARNAQLDVRLARGNRRRAARHSGFHGGRGPVRDGVQRARGARAVSWDRDL